jgi:acetyl esterase/lipase
VVPQQVIYTATDGMQIHGQLFLPPDSRPGQKHPALVFMHGGSRRQMLLGWHYMDYYNNAYGMNQYLASQGYVVLSINYRSGIGYGLNFREPANYGARGASEFNDVEGAGLYLKNRQDVDPAHVGLWGGSYGGYLTALGLARASSLFAAGVDFHGVHDWTVRNAANTGAPSGSGDPAGDSARVEAARVAYASSPMSSVNSRLSAAPVVAEGVPRLGRFLQTEAVGPLRSRKFGQQLLNLLTVVFRGVVLQRFAQFAGGLCLVALLVKRLAQVVAIAGLRGHLVHQILENIDGVIIEALLQVDHTKSVVDLAKVGQ